MGYSIDESAQQVCAEACINRAMKYADKYTCDPETDSVICTCTITPESQKREELIKDRETQKEMEKLCKSRCFELSKTYNTSIKTSTYSSSKSKPNYCVCSFNNNKIIGTDLDPEFKGFKNFESYEYYKLCGDLAGYRINDGKLVCDCINSIFVYDYKTGEVNKTL